MNKISVKVIKNEIHHNGVKYKVGDILEIEENYFLEKYMEKINDQKIKIEKQEEKQDEIKLIEATVKEYKAVAIKLEIEIIETIKDKIKEEIVLKANEKNIEIEVINEEILKIQVEENENS